MGASTLPLRGRRDDALADSKRWLIFSLAVGSRESARGRLGGVCAGEGAPASGSELSRNSPSNVS